MGGGGGGGENKKKMECIVIVYTGLYIIILYSVKIYMIGLHMYLEKLDDNTFEKSQLVDDDS